MTKKPCILELMDMHWDVAKREHPYLYYTFILGEYRIKFAQPSKDCYGSFSFTWKFISRIPDIKQVDHTVCSTIEKAQDECRSHFKNTLLTFLNMQEWNS